MKTFIFKLYTRTKQQQEFEVGQRQIVAKNADDAIKAFNKQDLPFHTFATIEAIK